MLSDPRLAGGSWVRGPGPIFGAGLGAFKDPPKETRLLPELAGVKALLAFLDLIQNLSTMTCKQKVCQSTRWSILKWRGAGVAKGVCWRGSPKSLGTGNHGGLRKS